MTQKTPILKVESKKKRPATAQTAPARDRSSWKEPDMQMVDESPVAMQHPRCPHCDTSGWLAALTLPGDGPGRIATAVCQTRWEVNTLEVFTMGAPCYVIEHKNDLIEERDARINELTHALLAAAKGSVAA